ncbi:MAG TPA: HEPN domain-containing protein [Methanoregulaceae archaeon]|nr:HEPN domain-containing protein [Methanoregulaceae archaeon]
MTLTDLDDCFARGKLRTVPSSNDKAQESLATAWAYLEEAKQVVPAGSFRLATNGVYFAWFHAARALLFRDGVREKSHYCIGRYLETYAGSGRLEGKWVTLFDRIRKKREDNQYSSDVPSSKEEIEGSLVLAEQFIKTIEDLIKNP